MVLWKLLLLIVTPIVRSSTHFEQSLLRKSLISG